jgi:protein phosphatase
MANLEIFARVEPGCLRDRNEDAFLVLDLATGTRGIHPETRIRPLGPPGTVLAVCDGMGGAAAGDVAAHMALDGLSRVLQARAPFTAVDQAEAALLQAVVDANRAIAEYAAASPERHGMGTTMTAALIFGTEVAIIQVGDSRAYLRRDRCLQPLTVDQNVVGQMVEAGQLTPEQARSYDQRNVLLQALGVQSSVGPDVVVVSIRAGDVLLLCSDGLTGPLPDEAILDLMVRYEDPMRCCRSLTEAACAAGGPDNIAVAIARFTGEDLPAPQANEPIVAPRRTMTV